MLLLAFAKNAAKEMSERVEARSSLPVTARTFHALALSIIGTVESREPALADHATDDLKFVNMIKEILRDLVRAAAEVSRAIIQWFSHFLVEPKTEWDFKTKHAFYRHMEQQDLRTLQGEKVKSYEELQIANWLYENGIEYEYEPIYEHQLPVSGKRDYCPDFRLTESGVYIEHFGVRRQKMPDGNERLSTAPFVDREEYLAGMAWKRKVHAEHETTLIETYSYERQEGRLLASLAEKLAPHVTTKPLPADTIFDRVAAGTSLPAPQDDTGRMEAKATIVANGEINSSGVMTMIPWWSFTKTALDIALMRLSEAGMIDLDERVAGEPFTPAHSCATRQGCLIVDHFPNIMPTSKRDASVGDRCIARSRRRESLALRTWPRVGVLEYRLMARRSSDRTDLGPTTRRRFGRHSFGPAELSAARLAKTREGLVNAQQARSPTAPCA